MKNIRLRGGTEKSPVNLISFFQCLQHRALNPDEQLPELSPLIANYLKPPQEVVTACGESMDKLKKKFKLEVVKKKEEKTGENLFKEKLVTIATIRCRQLMLSSLHCFCNISVVCRPSTTFHALLIVPKFMSFPVVTQIIYE